MPVLNKRAECGSLDAYPAAKVACVAMEATMKASIPWSL